MTYIIYIIPMLFIILALLVAYILYMNYESKFDEATTDDGDNEFEQLEKMIEDVKKLSEKRIYD